MNELYIILTPPHALVFWNLLLLKVLSRVNPTSCFDWLVVLCVRMVQVLIYLFQRSPYSFCSRTSGNEKESKTIRLLCMWFPNAKCHRLPPGSPTNQRSPRVGVVVVVMTIFSFISFGYFFHLKWLIVACTVAEVAIKAKATVNCRFFEFPSTNGSGLRGCQRWEMNCWDATIRKCLCDCV